MTNTPKPPRKALKRGSTRGQRRLIMDEYMALEPSDTARTLIAQLNKTARTLPRSPTDPLWQYPSDYRQSD